MMIKRLIRWGAVLSAIYCLLLGLLYGFQEKLFFVPTRLDENYQFRFQTRFEELNLKTADGVLLNGLHFYHPNPQGAILFFHGNSDSLAQWGRFSERFVAFGYDVYVFDYRGYGKSGGKIFSEAQFYSDADEMMKLVLKDFDASRIKLIGYSIGSGPAARAAEKFNVPDLVLIAPYFKLNELAQDKIPVVPDFLIKYKIPTVDFITAAKRTKITLVHGNRDFLINVSNSRKLARYLNPDDRFFELDANHNSVLNHPQLWQILGDRL